MRSGRFAIAKERILAELETVIVELFGAAASHRHRRTVTWNIANPWRKGSKPTQMVVNLRGRRGGWIDFVSGDKGDAIDLVAFALAGHVSDQSRKDAVAWAEERFGLRNMDPATRTRLVSEAAARRQRLEEESRASAGETRKRVQRFFHACDETILGTPVEVYLGWRGIALGEVPNLARSFRFRADCDYWPAGRGVALPAMVAAMVDHAGRLGACHLTFLARDGRGKAQLPEGMNAKLFKGAVAGLMIRVTNGPSGLNAEEAAYNGVKGPIGVTEGIEDALSAAAAFPALRMWAAGSLSGLMHIPNHFAADGWLIFRDNDWGKPQATALFDRAIARLRQFGKPVETLAMPADWGKDLNDALNQEI